MGFTILSMAIGGIVFIKIKRQVEHEKDAMGQEFQTRKEDFHERFNKNWNEKLDKLSKSFAESEKRRNKDALDLKKRLVNGYKEELNGKWYKPSETDKKELQKKLLVHSQEFAISEAAYKKKWFSQRENESIEQCERRRDEGEIDWKREFIKRAERRRKGIADEIEWEIKKEEIDIYREDLQVLQNSFQEKYGEPYEDIEFQKLCAVLKEQAQKEVQDFLDGIAAKESEKKRKEELVYLMKKRNEIVREEKDAQRERENSYPRLWRLQKVLDLYGEYNALKAEFEKKWGIADDEPLENLKAERIKERETLLPIEWEYGADYLKKAADLKMHLPGMEKGLNTKSIADLKQRLSKEEENFKKWKERGREDPWMDKEEARLEKLQFHHSGIIQLQ